MTPTFQVTLCFCILALCYTAPKTRNVRWCVTSDSENQKCNDLVKSCSIHEILLFCVKRASTEDCMRAISDGDADAISMDSGNLYKASLNPYKLKPIMEESRSFHRDITPCLRKRLLARKRPLLGAYVPQCDEKGDYRSLQCHGSTGYCWCINSNGEEIAGTKTPPGQTRPTCGLPAHTPCLKERQKHGEGQPLKGAYVPQCDEKGDYSPQQCHGSTGYCWCVNTNGEEIAGTKTPPGNTRVTCEVPAHTPCLKERQKHGGGKPLRGAYVPQCDEKGDYSPQQCHGSTGYCWCVNRNGTEIAGTKTPPGNTRVTCEVPAHTPCLKERQKHGEGQPLKGAYVPQCDEKGDYSPQQCHGSTGYCWCVNTNGEEIAGTKTPPGNTRVTCEVPAHTPCLKERQKHGGGKPLRGAYVPQCDEKGDYSPQQCHGSTGYCWCVNRNGTEIAGTKTPPGNTRVTCEVPAHTPCLKERQKHGGGQPLRGAYVPQCDEKGDYSLQQCHGSTGYCWCVNTNGEEIAGTKTPPGNTRVTCEVPAHTPCLKERQKLGGGQPLRGAYVPQCDEKGDYSPQQCHGSTGYCWCVNANGEEIAGTKTPPGQTRPTCKVPAHTPCLKERQKHGGGKPLLGAYVPQCDEKGDYSPQQCHGSTGYCWCVNRNGTEIAGTKTPPGNTRVTCEVPAHTPCLKERQKHGGGKPLLGAYVPQCDEKGDYSPQQCHGSTGYCWCVNANGEEIAGTKTPPGQTPTTCGAPVIDTPCLKERKKLTGDKTPQVGAHVPQCDEKGDYHPLQCHGSSGYCWCVDTNGKEIAGTKTPPGQTRPTCGVPAVDTPCLKERKKLIGDKTPQVGAYVPQCDEKGDYSPLQCHGSSGYCWCVDSIGKEIAGTKSPPGQTRPTCGVPAVDTPCLKERKKLTGDKTPLVGAHVPQCDEKGDYSPLQCHGSSGYCWCVDTNGKEIAGTRTPPGQTRPTCGVPAVDTPCLKERKKLIGDKTPQVGAYVPQCDEKGDYSPLQCHGSSGYCWCVDSIGKEIAGTKSPPGQTRPTCGVPAVDTPCLKERKKLTGHKTPLVGAHVPQCDEKGDYSPLQCHGSSGYCWCVDTNGKEIAGTKTPPGQTRPTCGVPVVDTPCLKERKKLIGDKIPLVGAHVPQCDEKGNFNPLQCHSSSGYCWCVDSNGEEIAATKTPPGQTRPTCGVPDSDTCHYAVAVVKKSRRFHFNELKGKTSCHSEVGNTASWNAPIKVLLKKNLLQWEGPEKKSIEKAVSEFFSASCIPGAKEANLCKQCAGEGDKKCQHSPVEPYYGDDGAFRCLRDDKGDVAFVKSTGLPGEYSKDYELLCPDNTRKPLNEAKDCNLGKVPSNAVVTRSSCDKSVDIIEFLLEAQKKQCNLFGSIYGKDLLFEGSTNSLIPLPSEMDTFLFLGAEWFNDLKALTVVDPPSKNKVHWCTQNRLEKLKCDDWSSVSGGAILCTEASSPDKCIEQIVKGEADAATLDVNHMYTALKCGLVPALEEYYNKDFGTQYAVALAKKSNKGISWNNLEGKKSCHTGVGHAIGWNIPVTLITKQTNNCDIGSYFNQSCAPGSTLNSNLCKLCIGDPENPKANTKCSLSDKEAYYGNEGAFRCLVEKGDVAFVSHTVVFENTDGKNSAGWAKNLNSNDFDLLCRDGSRASVSEYKNCNLARMPPRAIVTREESVTDVVRIVNNQQSLYGRKGFEKDIFQMFTSQQGQNLLFRDDTQCLIEFDRLLEDIVLDYFGPNYPRPNQCTSKSGLLSACTFHHC